MLRIYDISKDEQKDTKQILKELSDEMFLLQQRKKEIEFEQLIFKIIDFLETLEELIQNEEFKKENISEFTIYHDENLLQECILFSVGNEKNEVHTFLLDSFISLGKSEHIINQFSPKEEHILPFTKEGINKLGKLLLGPELISVYEKYFLNKTLEKKSINQRKRKI